MLLTSVDFMLRIYCNIFCEILINCSAELLDRSFLVFWVNYAQYVFFNVLFTCQLNRVLLGIIVTPMLLTPVWMTVFNLDKECRRLTTRHCYYFNSHINHFRKCVDHLKDALALCQAGSHFNSLAVWQQARFLLQAEQFVPSSFAFLQSTSIWFSHFLKELSLIRCLLIVICLHASAVTITSTFAPSRIFLHLQCDKCHNLLAYYSVNQNLKAAYNNFL